MPMYEYQCRACAHRFEVIQKFSDAPLASCPKCKKRKLERLVSSPAIQFKGTGWYITDYARKSSPEKSKSEGESDSSKEAAKETKTSKESRPADSSGGDKSSSSSQSKPGSKGESKPSSGSPSSGAKSTSAKRSG